MCGRAALQPAWRTSWRTWSGACWACRRGGACSPTAAAPSPTPTSPSRCCCAAAPPPTCATCCCPACSSRCLRRSPSTCLPTQARRCRWASPCCWRSPSSSCCWPRACHRPRACRSSGSTTWPL
ncbi:CHRNA10 isoform 2 [Pan troglodytes]|uniref:Cholinergic receptor nicotinic alpha 10 subunit n=2 Tax=Homininae TaxID=207598 RepID=E9PNX2_HUMAN|nr:cholinergic receptor nicotinic alpha 10 subunit [Homo sapiens]KAI4069575.1 cholinergic receptor nicotinic alpha 10 subunit [Homo sapiens]PNI14008.1 CHRNA10 isoform 2 [Pan troglodytes]